MSWTPYTLWTTYKRTAKSFCKAGDQEHQAILREKSAEDRAAEIQVSVDTPHTDQTQSTEVGRVLASAVEVSTDDAMRL